ncbi:zinc-dependent metalloprotease [Salegentibacter mishustinae]|uniref:zinc-dependent metalloprotease n=1 Tax=Salegentibacter mishustinae TaxID=270918 RepID=UPI001CE0DF06|nr:zinc-dependent metalloprotease [Salegentibacter mishustinae]UBZ06675.1 zinc-dependent metalloprotease [Salegentibacter mishustinae]
MKHFLLIFLLVSFSVPGMAQFLSEKENLREYEGFFNFHYNEKKDEIYLEVNKLESEFLYVHALTSGLGSNDIGLDRGQLGNEAIVKFQKAGNKLLLVQPNQRYRAETDNALEKRSVEQAFAKSVIYGFEIKEENDSVYIIDFTPFLMEDAHDVAGRLKKGEYGTYKLDKSKSALSLERTKAFPENVEFEALLTFEGEPKGRVLQSVAPDPKKLSVIQHHSFVKLPDNNYQKRLFDPRSGAISISYLDYSTPVYEPIEKKFAIRHRIKKKNPKADISEAEEPIVYYLDPGTPEPVKSALLEGARWWNEAFEEIGYKDAFQVKMLPEDADPLDTRYNMIQWVHRSTRGWSYGASVVDPRTGEIIKGHVSLGSLRIRQDFMIAQALLNKPFAESDKNHEKMMEMAVSRIRQLAAHEIGHTIGFAHNFAASVNDNASVMDYPHPQFSLENDEISIANAYDTGIGEWDKVTVKYSYADIPENTSEREFLNSVLEQAQEAGHQFISDSDARAQGGAHINAHLWDNGNNATEELERILKIRKKGIGNFSVDNIRTSEPYSVLEDVFVPLYFLHRYQVEAAVKIIGGLDYNYVVKGGNIENWESATLEMQKNALNAILKTLDAEVIAIPEEKLELFPPRAFGYNRSRESFKSNTGVSFDALGAPVTSANLSLSLLLHPERMARLVQQKSLDKKQLGPEEVLNELISNTIKKSHRNAYLNEVQEAVNYQVLLQLIKLAENDSATAKVEAIANAQIDKLKKWLSNKDGVFYQQMLREIDNYRENPSEYKTKLNVPEIPDGSPIGSFRCEAMDYFRN